MSISTWPVHPRKLPDELLSSWLYRIAQAHGLKLHTFTQRALPGHAIWNRDIDKTASLSLVCLLAERLGRPQEEVEQSTLATYEGYLYEQAIQNGWTRWILPAGVYHRERKHPGLVFCPLCLNDDTTVYFRRAWRLAFTVICPTHHIQMLDSCPFCNSIIAFHRNDFKNKNEATDKPMTECYTCGNELKMAAPITEADHHFIRFQKDLFEALNIGYTMLPGRPIYSFLFLDVIHQLVKLISLNRFGYSLRKILENEIGITLDYKIAKGTHTLVESLPLEERRHALRLISYLIIDWPQRFISLCQAAQLSRCYLERDMYSKPFWYQNVLKEFLDQKTVGASVEEFNTVYHMMQAAGEKITFTAILRRLGYGESKVLKKHYSTLQNMD